jgi:hypothetical protein
MRQLLPSITLYRRHHQTRSFNAGASFLSTAVTAAVTACPKLDSPFLSPLVFANPPLRSSTDTLIARPFACCVSAYVLLGDRRRQ